ncbi:hypothetical protein LT493_04285 [Streptomyces tricolor]|nr:hypothetical protein [Streptomyces tricolor]
MAFVALNALWLMPLDGVPRKLVQAAAVHHVQMPAWAPDRAEPAVLHGPGRADGRTPTAPGQRAGRTGHRPRPAVPGAVPGRLPPRLPGPDRDPAAARPRLR